MGTGELELAKGVRGCGEGSSKGFVEPKQDDELNQRKELKRNVDEKKEGVDACKWPP